jgi:transcriptional regulator with XRE-family HTH domain
MSNIYQIRQELNWTTKQLADYLGVHERTVSRWEAGETRPSALSVKMLLRLQQDIISGKVTPYTPEKPQDGKRRRLKNFLDELVGWIKR